MAGFALSPWAGVVVGAGTAVAQTLAEPGSRAATIRHSSRRHLGDLARSVAGSVDVVP